LTGTTTAYYRNTRSQALPVTALPLGLGHAAKAQMGVPKDRKTDITIVIRLEKQ
jgi:hypothetical protein